MKAALARGHPPDAVITELGMPQVGGRQVAQSVTGTFVVMLIGWGRRMNEDGECPPHVDHLLSKPPRLSALRAGLVRCAEGVDPTRKKQ